MDPVTRHQYLQAMGVTQWQRNNADVPVAVDTVVEKADEASLSDLKAQAQAINADVDQAQNSLEVALERAIAEPPPEIIEQAAARPVPVSEPGALASVSSPELPEVASLDWPALKQAAESCRECQLCEGRSQVVFGTGVENAELMVVGEAPNAEEEQQGFSFAGPSGQLLDAMLKAIGYSRQPVAEQKPAYLSNIVKCRPADDRDPMAEEMQACRAYLDRQIALIQPKLILAVGGVAAKSLLDSDKKVGELRGAVHQYGTLAIPLLVTYHPTYLRHSPSEKRKAWDDLKQARSLLQAG